MTSLYIVFRVAGAEYIVAASDVLQMESYHGATLVPGAAPHVTGIIQVRGRIIPVVDVRARFGLPPAETTMDTRVVIVQLGERTVALRVDSAREVLKLDPAELQPPPRILSEGALHFVKAIAHLEKRLLMQIDCEKVVGEEENHVD